MRNFKVSRQPIPVIGPSIAYVPLSQGMFSLIDLDEVDRVSATHGQLRCPRNITR